MKLTGNKLYQKESKEEIGLIVFADGELNPRQKTLYEKAELLDNVFLVSVTKGWDIEDIEEKEYLKEIILDNFPSFIFNGKSFWFYQKQDLDNVFFIKKETASSVLLNE